MKVLKVRIKRRKILGIAIVLVVLLVAVPAFFIVPFTLRVQRFEAEPLLGFHADFYLYVSPERGVRQAPVSW